MWNIQIFIKGIRKSVLDQYSKKKIYNILKLISSLPAD